MAISTQSVKTIDKESIPSLNFPEKDILVSVEKQLLRNKNIQVACDYGNEMQHKVAIYFQDDQGRKKVETTIWDVTEEDVLLKHNVSIPKHRIVEIKF